MSGNYKHGGRGTRLYGIWKAMRQRCHDPHCNRYHIYGGKGITICPEWDDFACFRQWAYENGYDYKLSLDRIDGNGNYEPSNCRWATILEQQNNRSTNRRLSLNGEEHTMAEWSRLTGISASTIGSRLKRNWSVEQALTTPIRQKKSFLISKQE